MPVTARPREQAKILLDSALEQEIGLGVPTNSQQGAINLLTTLRKDNPKYAGLILFAPNNGEVFICKKEVELD